MGDAHVGLQARLMSQALRKLTGVLAKSRTTAIFINQIREKVGVMYGNPETTPGGRALKFYSSVRIEVRRKTDVKVGGDKVGNRTRVKITKNKVAPPFREAEVDIIFGKGIDKLGDLLTIASDLDVVQKSGSFYKYMGETIGQGQQKAAAHLRENPQLIEEIKGKVFAKIKGEDEEAQRNKTEQSNKTQTKKSGRSQKTNATPNELKDHAAPNS